MSSASSCRHCGHIVTPIERDIRGGHFYHRSCLRKVDRDSAEDVTPRPILTAFGDSLSFKSYSSYPSDDGGPVTDGSAYTSGGGGDFGGGGATASYSDDNSSSGGSSD